MSAKLKPDRLLAKSVEGRWRGSYSLAGHTADVVRAVTLLVETLGDRLVEQFDLGCDLDYLRKTARLAAYLHDWGKTSDHFQGVVRYWMPDASPKRHALDRPQLLRHEALSIFLAWEFRDWLQQADGDFTTALAAAGGHHLKMGRTDAFGNHEELGKMRSCGDDRVTCHLNHPDFKRVLRFGMKQLGCPSSIKLKVHPISEWSEDVVPQRRSQIEEFFLEWDCNAVLTAVVKALLVAGDSIGSAIGDSNLQLDRWIREDSITHTLTLEEISGISSARLGDNEPREFQKKLGAIVTRVGLARAGCGTGKTVGAYFWAKQHAVGRKLFFCYPTTGTSTEGFIDYVQDEVASVLLHSRASVDLELAKLNLELTTTGEEQEAGDGTENEASIKLNSFEAWEKKVTVCTVDAVLGLMQCHRRPMYCFPALANAAFVFDEVHCYDKSLFGALLRFLETVKAPVLLMSASFLPPQLDAIKQALGEPLSIVSGPAEVEAKPRYQFHDAEKPNWQRVEAELKSNGKVLWVCNQVSTAVAVYEEAQRRGLNAKLYHSRYRYEDRVRHHREVVDAFKQEQKKPVLAIATQVAEMSLDLSATLLISQIAPPAALIQRLGRLNRRYCDRALDAYFYADLKKHPYSPDERTRGLAMVQEFSGDVSQADLAQWLEQEDFTLKPERHSVLLEGEWRTYPGPLRQSGATITCLLERDRPLFGKQGRSQLSRYAVPLIANPKQVGQWPRHQGFPVAPSDAWDYCTEKGAIPIKSAKGSNI
ncbi:CRISPR-associated helicase/endonuclease Cas3 [Synechococcus sp. PCC 7336]|uniref:CRISPR-associated helicase/endonuclease Cas3 n=1 Tax=Synechococcus sp. PCC 7336 TaxID=195250 RepID=UPI000346501D|nr:CRISPR-associated helicase/endonuclease Cas3 [Synechococcus sp. PCC 7336]